jgi:hypothetical protein
VIWRSSRAATFLARLNYFDLSHCAWCLVSRMKCHMDAFLWIFLFCSCFINSLCCRHLQIWFLELVYMVWILQCSVGKWCVLNLWCKQFLLNSSNGVLGYEMKSLRSLCGLILQTIRSWHIIGRLGGCNSINMQVRFAWTAELFCRRLSCRKKSWELKWLIVLHGRVIYWLSFVKLNFPQMKSARHVI